MKIINLLLAVRIVSASPTPQKCNCPAVPVQQIPDGQLQVPDIPPTPAYTTTIYQTIGQPQLPNPTVTTACPYYVATPSPVPEFNTSACGPDFCAGTLNNASNPHFVCGDARLGPVTLPMMLPISLLTQTYHRFGGLCPGAFLAKWFNATSGYYNYPPMNGYALNTAGNAINGTVELEVGMRVDRFGSEYGAFVSPAGAPYVQRSLPPSNLDTAADMPMYPYQYHVYEVLQPIQVVTGPIAPWFGQPGQGVQFYLGAGITIMKLLNQTALRRVDLSEQ